MNDEFGNIDTYLEQDAFRPFFSLALGAKVHWFFIEGTKAVNRELYVAGCLALLNGIEISLRQTLHLIRGESIENDLDSWEIMKDKVLLKAMKIGLPIRDLRFPGEDICAVLLNDGKSKIVETRNNLCHGNVHEFVITIPGSNDKIFTPECLRDLSKGLIEISERWATSLGNFCRYHDIRA